MSTATAAPEVEPAQPRYILGGGGGGSLSLLLLDDARCVPKLVQEAQAAAVQAYDRLQQASSLHRAAKEEASRAPSLDRSAL